MMLLPVWLPGPMFLPGVPVPGPMFIPREVSVQGVSVQVSLLRWSLSTGVSVKSGVGWAVRILLECFPVNDILLLLDKQFCQI